MTNEPIEVMVRCIEPAAESDGPMMILLGPCNEADAGLIALPVHSAEAHLLDHELAGEVTLRSQVVVSLSRVAAALGGDLIAAHLIASGSDGVSGALELQTPLGRVGIDIAPGQALAAAVCIGLPLFADRALFAAEHQSEKSDSPPLSAEFASFLAGLDLGGLPRPNGDR